MREIYVAEVDWLAKQQELKLLQTNKVT